MGKRKRPPLREILGKLLDPRGPIGELLSPSIVYKERQGLPVDAPYTQRFEGTVHAEYAQALAPPRFVQSENADVPESRTRQISAFLVEQWAPVYKQSDSTNLWDIFRASEELVGWNVTQQIRNSHCDCTHAKMELDGDGRLVHAACGRASKRLSQEDFEQVIQSMNVIPSDEFYNGLVETVPGNDPIVLDGEILRGEATYDHEGRMTHDGIVRGTVITKGRREYNERTKGFVHWDKGFAAQREAAINELNSRPVRNVKRMLDSIAGEKRPMKKIIGVNPRYDRRSAV